MSQGVAPSGGRVTRLGPWVVALGAASALIVWHWSDGPGPAAADYAQYLGHARALAQGRPYTDTGYIFTPLFPWAGPQAQPPGLPLVLATVFRIVGESDVAAKIVLLAFALGFYLSAGLYFARLDDSLLGIAVVWLLGMSTEMARAAGVAQTDLPFACLIWVVIALYDREGRFTPKRIAAITFLGGLALATRTFGVALIPATVLFTILNWRQHGLMPAIPALVWVSAFLIANTVLPITAGFPSILTMVQTIPEMVPHHAIFYRFALFGTHLYPLPWNAANDVYHAVAALLAIVALATWLPGAFRRFSVAFSAPYVAMLLMVPVLDVRYMWPVSPLLAFGLVRGLAQVAERVRPAQPSAHSRAGFALAAAALIGVLNVAWIERSADPLPSMAARPEVQDLFRAVERLTADRPIRVAFVRPQVLAYETGVPSMTTFARDPQTLVSELNRRCITHVVLGDLGLAPVADASFRELVQRQPETFQLEYRNESFEIHRFTGLSCRGDS